MKFFRKRVNVSVNKIFSAKIVDSNYKISGFINISGDFYKIDDLEFIKVENKSKIN